MHSYILCQMMKNMIGHWGAPMGKMNVYVLMMMIRNVIKVLLWMQIIKYMF
jgi:hypothetical protein